MLLATAKYSCSLANLRLPDFFPVSFVPHCLLVYPEFPPSYWSHKYALEFINRKASHPPLGLLTLAGLFPAEYNLRLIDMNVRPLAEEALEWADYVFISSMVVQQESFREVVERCNNRNIPVIAGGPYPASFWEEIPGVSHFVLGEVEEFFEEFLSDLTGKKARSVYHPPLDKNGNYGRPPMSISPLPRYDLIGLTDYSDMSVQFSRGCPFHCDFCDITKLYGRSPRTKSSGQIISELDRLFAWGWRGAVFFVDDNFIGNKRNAMKLLPLLAEWQKERDFPFDFYTEASVNLADDSDLMENMKEAGFGMVFLGIETPNAAVLKQIDKDQNVNRADPDYLLNAVHKVQDSGMEVSAGFILGLDGDTETSFDAQIDFIQKAGIPTAMVGLLIAVKGTKLYERLEEEGRVLDIMGSGNNVASQLNFIPELDKEVLLAGYRRVLKSLYEPSLKSYFERCFTLFTRWKPPHYGSGRITIEDIRIAFKSLSRQIFSRQGPAYLKFLIKVLRHHPRMLGEAFELAVSGYHYEKVTRQQIMIDEFRELLQAERTRLCDLSLGRALSAKSINRSMKRLARQCRRIGRDFRSSLAPAINSFDLEMTGLLKPSKGALPLLNLMTLCGLPLIGS